MNPGPVAGVSAPRVPRIKFCGLTRSADAELAVRLGAHYLGGIRAGGPRRLDASAWRELLGATQPGVERVAVVGHLTVPELIAEAEALQADIVQWHGDPSPDDVARARDAGLRIWPVLRIAEGGLPPLAWSLAAASGALVLDAKVPGQLGGTGVPLDWAALAADVSRWRVELPHVVLVLAGGLHAGNVRQASALLEPDVVDVSSGVELAPGIKDPERMRAFADAVRGS